MGIYSDCKTVVDDKPPVALTALEREVLYARIRAFSVRVQYTVWNIAAIMLLYLFNGSMLNGYLWNGHIYKVMIFHAIQLLSIIAYFCTSLSNPGHVPLLANEYSLFEHDEDDDQQQKQQQQQGDHASTTSTMEPWNRNIMIDPNNAPFNFCWRCKMVRPIRSKHCYDCDRCISKFDHHCPMVGNCVGGKNHRFFVLFLCAQSIIVVWCFQLSLTDLYTKYHNVLLRHSSDSSVAAVADNNNFTLGVVLRLMFFMAMFFSLLIVVGLCGFHLYLSSTNQTTYEMVKPHILEKWVKEENKRKKKYFKKHAPLPAYVHVDVDVYGNGDAHPKHGEYQPVQLHEEQQERENDADVDPEVNMDEDTENVDDIDDSYYRSPQHNNMISFDEGTCRNLYAFWTATLNKEWMTPFPCVLMDDEDDRSD